METYAGGFSSYRSKALVLPTANLLNLAPPLQRRLVGASCRVGAALLDRIPSPSYSAVVRVVELGQMTRPRRLQAVEKATTKPTMLTAKKSAVSQTNSTTDFKIVFGQGSP